VASYRTSDVTPGRNDVAALGRTANTARRVSVSLTIWAGRTGAACDAFTQANGEKRTLLARHNHAMFSGRSYFMALFLSVGSLVWLLAPINLELGVATYTLTIYYRIRLVP
jgi:hypothetical protein